jgi:hypothetical protein
MESALRVYSWKGFFAESVDAVGIKSRGVSRNLGPFVAPDRGQLVTWVRSSWKDNRQVKRSHFRRLPITRLSGTHREQIESYLDDEQGLRGSSMIHHRCRDTLADALRKRLGTPLEWFIADPELSEFPFRGDLLRGVEEIQTEYHIATPFGKDYILDVALLGPEVGKKRIILGGIELELHHEFDHLKCLLCKCLGFPLASIDIGEFTDGDVEETNLLSVLTETTTSSDDGRRRNFFYLHPCLLPVFVDAPSSVLSDPKHQFVVFASDERFPKIVRYLKLLRDRLNLDPSVYAVAPVRPKGESGATMIANEGSIAGHDWRDYNSREYIRLSVPRPTREDDANYFFHLTFAQIVNAHEPALVGYKFEPRIYNFNPESSVWIKRKFSKGQWTEHRICPKHLSDPIESILNAIASIGTAPSNEQGVDSNL